MDTNSKHTYMGRYPISHQHIHDMLQEVRARAKKIYPQIFDSRFSALISFLMKNTYFYLHDCPSGNILFTELKCDMQIERNYLFRRTVYLLLVYVYLLTY